MAKLLVSDPALRARLNKAGHEATWRSGEPAIADLVLLHFDGGPVAGESWVRDQRERSPDTPLLVICSDTESAERALAAGADDVLREPISAAVLAARLRAWLRDTASSSSPAHLGFDLLPRLIEASPDPVVAVDLSGKVLLFSRAAEEVLGYDSQSIAELHVEQLYATAGAAAAIMERLKAAEGHRINGVSVRLRSKQGESISVRLSATLVHDTLGRPVASLGIFRDDREQQALARALENTSEQLEQSEARATLLDHARAGLAELSSPLTQVLGRLELASLDTHMPDSVRVHLAEAQAPLEQLLRRTRRLTERLDSGT